MQKGNKVTLKSVRYSNSCCCAVLSLSLSLDIPVFVEQLIMKLGPCLLCLILIKP